MDIIQLDIDEESSIESYAKTCLVLDGYFAWVGYQMGEDQEFLEMVRQAIAGEELSVDNHEIYFFKEGQTFYEGG